jgi:type IV pilus assembly protein PilO
MNLDDIRRLNIHDAGNWPWAIKGVALAIVFVVVVFLGWLFFWRDQWDALDQARAQEEKLRGEFTAKKAQAINLDLYVQQKKEIEDSFGMLLKQLPNKSEMDALLIDINQAGLGRGLQFELFKPAAHENFSDFYAELPISLKLTGNYHDIGAFASDIAQLPRIVTLNDINIASGKESLVMEAVAKTYRYLDESEIAKQRRDKAAKDKGQAK